MNTHLLQAAMLAWTPSLRVTRAEGDLSSILRRPAGALLEQPLHEVLGVSPKRARELDARAREDRRAVEFISANLGGEDACPLRLSLGLDDGEASATVLDLNAMLDGAPRCRFHGCPPRSATRFATPSPR